MASKHARRVPEEDKQRIIEMVRSGMSRYAVAKATGWSRDTVSKIARAAGLDADTASTEAGTRAMQRYAKAERIELINHGFDKVRAILSNIDGTARHAKALREAVTALGILIDKRRLEEGEATERTETVTIVDDIGE